MRVVFAVGVTVVIIASCLFFTNGSQDIDRYQCNGTDCTYTAMAEYATCQNLNLVRIPPQCSSAVYLDFRRNDLQFLDGTSLTGFVKLKYLYLDGNQIRNITPRAFEACASVQQIFLQNNPIIIIRGEVFSGLHDLRHLYLNLAKLEVIHQHAFDDLRALERLFLSDNKLRSLPHDLFHQLSNLKILTLANNHLHTLSNDAFRGLQHLEYLDIKHNRLISLPSGIFNGMIRLDRLILSHNHITTVEYLAINTGELNNLESVDLRNNRITTLGNFSNLEGLSKVYFADNPIDCDCRSRWLLRWYQINHGAPSVNDPGAMVICHGPPALAGQPLKNLTQDQLTCENGMTATVKPQDARNGLPLGPNLDYEIPLFGFDKWDNHAVNPITFHPLYEKEPTIEVNWAPLRDNDPLPPDENHTITPFVWMGLAIGSAIVLVVILALVYIKCHMGNDPETPKSKESENRPSSTRPHPTITENPMEDHHVYEPVHSSPQVTIRDSKNHAPPDRTNADSAFLDDFVPDPTDEYVSPIQPLPPSSHHLPPQDPYISLESMQSVPPVMLSQHPQLLHTVSSPASTGEHMPDKRPHSHSYPPSNPFVAPSYQCIHNVPAQPMQNGYKPNVSVQIQDPSNNLSWPYMPPSDQPVHRLAPSHHSPIPSSTPMANDATFEQKSTNPFSIPHNTGHSNPMCT